MTCRPRAPLEREVLIEMGAKVLVVRHPIFQPNLSKPEQSGLSGRPTPARFAMGPRQSLSEKTEPQCDCDASAGEFKGKARQVAGAGVRTHSG